jgi:carbonic anhydrase
LSVVKKIRLFSIIPGLLLVVVFAIILNQLFLYFSPAIAIKASHLVKLPVLTMPSDLFNYFIHPDLSFLKNVDCYVIAFTLAIVGSLETLLGAEATDKLDNERMITPTNRELKAQGIGNILSGLVGGLPITQVIVRSSANIGGGAKSKLSTILHGFWLLLAVLFGAKWLNLIPLSVLAALLVFVGYKLTKINLFKEQFKNGLDQFIPFVSTILGVLFTDLLIGIAIGIAVSMFFLLRKNFKNDYRKELNDGVMVLYLSEDVSFLNKASIKAELNDVPSNYILKIDGTACKNIDFDVLELMREFVLYKAPQKNISVELINIKV